METAAETNVATQRVRQLESLAVEQGFQVVGEILTWPYKISEGDTFGFGKIWAQTVEALRDRQLIDSNEKPSGCVIKQPDATVVLINLRSKRGQNFLGLGCLQRADEPVLAFCEVT